MKHSSFALSAIEALSYLNGTRYRPGMEKPLVRASIAKLLGVGQAFLPVPIPGHTGMFALPRPLSHSCMDQ